MSQKIQLRRGTNAARQSVVFDMGEPVFTSDTNALFVGDGVTAGGVSVGEGSSSYASFLEIKPTTADSSAENGTNLYNSLNTANTKTPNGKPRSTLNRFSIFLYPGHYDYTHQTIALTGKYIDIIGVGNKEDIVLYSNAALQLLTGECNIKNLSVINTGNGSTYTISYGAYNTNELKNITLDSVFVSGNYGIHPSDAPYFFSDINSLTVKNSTVIGHSFGAFVDSDDIFIIKSYAVKDSLFENTVFDFRNTLKSTTYSYVPFFANDTMANKNNIFNNCKFLLNTGKNTTMFASNSSFGYSYDNTNLFKNCYFSGASSAINTALFLDVETNATLPFQARTEGCIFDANIGSFYGTMHNCIVNGKNSSAAPISLNNAATPYPAFYNCTVLSSGSYPSVTGVSVTTSGLFSHCRFNNFVQTGVTGRFGNQLNIVSPYIK